MRTRSKFFWPALTVLTVMFTLSAAAVAFADVQTDQYYYQIGDTVYITGNGMQGGEAVFVEVNYPDGTLAQHHEVPADEFGNFTDTFTLADGMPAGDYTVVATGQASGSTFTTTFDPAPSANANWATTGLPAGTSVTVSYNGTNNGGNPQVGSITFAAPGPSGNIGFDPGSSVSCAFPASITVGANTYNLVSSECPATVNSGSPPIPAKTIHGNYQLQVSNHAPTATVPSFSPSSPKTNDNLTASSTLSDPDAGDTITSTFLWKVTTGGYTCDVRSTPKAAVASGTLVSDSLDLSTSHATSNCSPSLGAPASINPAKGNTVAVYVTPTDNHSLSGTQVNSSVVIANTPPNPGSISGLSPVDEGSQHTYSDTTASDADGDTLTYVWSVSSGNATINGSNTGSSVTLDFGDGYSGSTATLHLVVSDGTDTASPTDKVITINNVAPVVTSPLSISGGGVACLSGNTATLGFSWTDAGGNADKPFSYDVDWGDGSLHTTGSNVNAFSVSGLTHPYAAGSWTISVKVTDKDGSGDNGQSAALTGNVSFLYNATGVLQPVNYTQGITDPDISVFKYGSTLPIKIQVTDCLGTPVPNLTNLKVTINKQTSSTPTYGIDEIITNTNSPDAGGYMRWSDPIYIYNLATKSLADSTATYKITITGPVIATVTAYFGTRAK
jgi:hypothetical protein